MLSNIKGQEQAIANLKQLISSEKVAQSYLFYGPSGVGKLTTAFQFAKAVNCQNQKDYDCCDNCSSCRKVDHFSHPDIDFIYPTPKFETSAEGGYKKETEQLQVQNFIEKLKSTPYSRFQFSKATSIQIDTIRNLERKIRFKPGEGKYRIIIIAEADEMTRSAANAFLKTLEEPPSYVIIILTTTKLSALLPTIISRCQKVRFNPIPPEIVEKHLIEKYQIEELQAKICARISNGSIAKAILMSQTEMFEARNMALDFVRFIVNKDFEGIHNFSDNFSHNRNEELLKDILDFLVLWFGDITYLHHSPERIVNIDQKEELERFYQIAKLTDKSIREIIDLIEKGKELIIGHINFELIVLDTFFQIYKRVYQNQKR
ncbi:MAG: DNA polymerase III subunit delta' [Candidatus Cloacimonetes bacterium]|nr:DNA polymerase III subunit delta' [Candidatus Cloacimonadota bacterium]